MKSVLFTASSKVPTIQQMIIRFFQRKDGRMDGWMKEG